MTLRDYIAAGHGYSPWQKHYRTMRPATQRRSMDAIRRFGPLMARPVADIEPGEVVSWYEEYCRTGRVASANRSLDVLRQIMNHAIEREHRTAANPCSAVQRVKLPPRTRWLSRDELRRIYRELRRMRPRLSTGRGHLVLIRLLLLTGMRVGEACGLRWADLSGDSLSIRDGKTGPRQIYLSREARDLLAEWRTDPDFVLPWVFPRRDGSGPRSNCISTWLAVRKRAGLEDVRLHDLRHTFAAHAAMSGVPLPVLQQMLGHASLGMTMRYAHIGDRRIVDAAEKVGRHIDGLIADGELSAWSRPGTPRVDVGG